MAVKIGSMTSDRPMVIYTQCCGCGHQAIEEIPQGSGYSTKPCGKCSGTSQNMQMGSAKPKWWRE
ncbi:putative zinc transporter 4 [Pseudomonas phage HU1]|nr:putative zinc transporter 4 [Pseudomonas phage HU1]